MNTNASNIILTADVMSASLQHNLKLPLNKGQGHSFRYQSIPHIWLPIGCQQ